MTPSGHKLPKLLLLALAGLFSALLLSTAVLPTVMSVSGGKAIAAPAPIEEEQLHARETLFHLGQDHRDWAASAASLGASISTGFRRMAEAVPEGPISEVPLQPPRSV